MSAALSIRSRIIGYERIRGRDLVPHPLNPRVHGKEQRRVVTGSLETLGQIEPLPVWRSPAGLHILDGHLRASIADDAELDVAITDLTEAEARIALAILDPSSALASTEDGVLEELLREIERDTLAGVLAHDDRLDPLLGELAEESPASLGAEGEGEGEGSGEDEEPGLTRRDVPDALFPTDNEWGVPLLDLKMQAKAVDLPAVAWGSVARTARMRGTWHFYTEDYRYAALIDDASPVVNTGCINAVEPNFSCYEQMPRAPALFRIYQKRWIARWWQSHGVRIFVDLNVAEPFADLNLLGVPQGWRAYATRGYTERLDATGREYDLARERAGSDDLLFLVYGGGKAVAAECGRRGWIHVDEHMNRRQKDG